MSLSGALSNSLSGLRVTQSTIDVISGNVANADSIGYSRRRLVAVESETSAAGGSGVRIQGVQRLLDTILQREYRTETSGAGYSATKYSYLSQAEQLFGQPGGSNSLDSLFNDFTKSLDALATDPSAGTARSRVLSAADTLARGIRSSADGIQALRADAESAMAKSVQRANELIKGIAAADVKVLSDGGKDPSLLDMRDAQINELATLMDLRVSENSNGSVSLQTVGGLRLCDAGNPTTLSFDAKASIGANAVYDTDPAKRLVGTITVTDSSGAQLDVIGQKLIRSGKIAALVEMRDSALVEAQAQLDELAASMSSALSDRQVSGSAVTAGTSTGFDVDTTGLLPGNMIMVKANIGGVAKSIAVVRVDDATQLPLKAGSVAGADMIVGVSFAGTLAASAASIDSALGAGFDVSAVGGKLRFLDDGSGTAVVTGVSAGVTNTTLTGAGAEFPLFTDGGRNGAAYTGSFDGGSSKTGFAGRIGVNSALLLDPSRLVVYSTSPQTAAGDVTRPTLLRDRVLATKFTFAPTTGIGATNSPFTGTVRDFVQRVVETRGAASADAQRLDEGQKVVLNSIEARFSQSSGVSVDQEMAHLVQVQNAYAANARILAAVKDMMDLLLRM